MTNEIQIKPPMTLVESDLLNARLPRSAIISHESHLALRVSGLRNVAIGMDTRAHIIFSFKLVSLALSRYYTLYRSITFLVLKLLLVMDTFISYNGTSTFKFLVPHNAYSRLKVSFYAIYMNSLWPKSVSSSTLCKIGFMHSTFLHTVLEAVTL